MVRIRNLLLSLVMVISIHESKGQRIRKDYREMTSSEKLVFVNAIKASRSFVENDALHHECHFGGTNALCPNAALEPVHNNQLFLPWHRMFLIDFEDAMRGASTGDSRTSSITVPYWDWRDEPSNPQWNDQNFLGQFNNPTNFTWFGNLGRVMSGSMNNRVNVNGNVSQVLNANGGTFSTFLSNFSFELERGVHNAGHSWIGGAMGGAQSPRDPIFNLHHNMVDKIWQEWEDRDNAVQSVFTATSTADIPYNPNTLIDSRNLPYNGTSLDVWFAYKSKLLLDGLMGDFQATGTKSYCYVAWNGSNAGGTIYAGDVRRDGGNSVIPDDKGGFTVQSGRTDFSAGSAIELLPGFSVTSGAVFSAQIVDRPCGYSSNFLVGGQEESNTFLKSNNRNSTATSLGQAKAYPNPFADFLNVSYPVVEDTPLSIELINGLGQVVWQRQFGTQSKGEFQTVIPSNDLPKGLYTVLIHAGTEQKVLKVVH